MNRFFSTVSLLLFSILLNAQNKKNPSVPATQNTLSDGATLLFQNVKSKLTAAEKNSIFQKMKLTLSADKKSFVMDDIPISAFVFPTDMNKDGKEEVFVGLESIALFGDRESFSLYIKNNSGTYLQQTEIVGGRPVILSTKNSGYPDILIGGPGFEHPVYRWNGTKYTVYKKMRDEALNNDNSKDIEEYSKLYAGN